MSSGPAPDSSRSRCRKMVRGIHTQVARGAGAVAAVEAEHFVGCTAAASDSRAAARVRTARQLVGVDAEVLSAYKALSASTSAS